MNVTLTIKFEGVADKADCELIEEKVQDLVDELTSELGCEGTVE